MTTSRTDSGHRPKTAALAAFDAGALSPHARAQVESHLAGCEVCRAELASIRLWSRESAKMRAIREVPVDFSRMELLLAREAKAEARKGEQARSSRRLVPMLAPLGLAAAVLLTLGLDRALSSDEATSPSAAAVASVVVERVSGEAEVVLVAGAPRVRGHDDALAVGDRLPEGAVIDTGDGELHLALGVPIVGTPAASDAPGASVALRGGTTVHLVGLPAGPAAEAQRVELARGELTVRVGGEGFATQARAMVLAAAYRIEGEVALFDVTLEEGLVIEVREGSVHVTGNGLDETLAAPARFAPPELPVAHLGAGHGGPAPRSGALVRIERPSAVRWEVDGIGTLDGAGALAFRASPGPIHMVSFDALGRASELHEVVGPNGLLVAGEALAPAAPTVRGFLDPAVINGVVRTSVPTLERCYEHALRLRPDLGGGSLRIRVSVATDGSVTRTRVDGADVPASLQACVTSEAAGWTFPSPGAPVSFELPLQFRPR